MDEEHFAFVGDYYAVLIRGAKLIEKRLMTIKVKFMTVEERKKHEIIEESKRKYKEEQRKKDEIKEKLEQQSKADRFEQIGKVAKASKANPLTFGANIMKF